MYLAEVEIETYLFPRKKREKRDTHPPMAYVNTHLVYTIGRIMTREPGYYRD